MARSGQTDMAVLGALSIEPMSGYALRERIRDVLGHFWNESFGQIYPTLSALTRDGFVQRDDKFYAITEAGLIRLRELLAEPIQEVPPRNALLLRLFFGRTLGAPACHDLISQARESAVRRLAEYDELLASTASETGPDAPYIRMTILAGRHSAEAGIAWADECLAML